MKSFPIASLGHRITVRKNWLPKWVCNMTGIQSATIDNSAAYIKSWIGKFKEDKKILLIT